METDKNQTQTTQVPESQYVAPLPDSDKQDSPVADTATTQDPLECKGVFRALVHVAPLFLLLLLGLQVWPDFWHAYLGTALYCPAEAQHIRIAQEVSQATQFYAPMTSLPAQWPLYTWLLLGLGGLLSPTLQWLVYPLASAIPAFVALLAVWIYTRAVGFGAPAALAATLAALCAPLFAPLVHFVGPSASATALMLLSLAMFCRGWQAESAWLALAGAFLAAGLAGLTGGPFFLFVPLATSLLFLCWRCTFHRGHGLDAIFGFLLLLLLVAGWLGCVILFTHAEHYMQELFGSITQPWSFPRTMWWLPPALAVIGFSPWLGVIFCASWGKVIQKSWTSLKASRKERAGSSFAWLSMAVALPLAVIIPGQPAQPLAVALLCIAAPLVGKSLIGLSLWGRRVFIGMSAILLLLAGAALIACHFETVFSVGMQSLVWEGKELFGRILSQLQVLPVVGAGCIVASLFMVRFCRKTGSMGGFLLYCSIVATLLHQPATLLIAPTLGNIPETRLYRIQQTPAQVDNRQEEASPATSSEPDASFVVPEQPAEQPADKGTTQPADEAKDI